LLHWFSWFGQRGRVCGRRLFINCEHSVVVFGRVGAAQASLLNKLIGRGVAPAGDGCATVATGQESG
jgi:hypothetical protein